MRLRRRARVAATLLGFVVLLGGAHPGFAQVTFKMEGDQYTKTNTYGSPATYWDLITLTNTYVDPAIFIIPSHSGWNSADFRVRNITTTSFETTTAEPPGWDGEHVQMAVSYIVSEAGGWFLSSDIFLYVGFVEINNLVNSFDSSNWVTVNLPQGFTDPIVLVQIQGMANELNNPPVEISKPWFTASVRNVTATTFDVALDGSACTNVPSQAEPDCAGPYTLVPERVAYLVIDAGHNTTFDDDGGNPVMIRTKKTGAVIQGWSDASTPVPYDVTFPDANTILFVAKPQTRNDPEGGWFRFDEPLPVDQVTLRIDEAQGYEGNSPGDSRHHTTGEVAGMLLFERPFSVLDLDPDKDFIPNDFDNCDWVYNPGTPQADVDGDGVGDACDCGDGLVVAGEHCDDGNNTSGDGCSDTCLHEAGWWCVGEPSLCDGICGDSQIIGTEVCDDGNEEDDPACHSNCQSYCGDDALQLDHGEVCDGTELGGLDCVSIGLGFTGGELACDGLCELDTSLCTLCGNGVLEAHEVCDDGNNISGDGCTDACQPETGWTCSGEPSICVGICGDGRILHFETCDDGNLAAADGCSANCRVEPGWSCENEPSLCATVCGDGSQLAGEACDDGNNDDGDGCSADCAVEPGWVCPGGVCQGVCGNGSLEAAEACDDGNSDAGDGCFDCAVETGWECAGSPSYCQAICGDGVILGIEACDDGNAMGGDGCAGTCQIEPGWACAGEPSVCTSSCGDGWVVDVETCDDGNNDDGDGCSAACQTELGYVCEGNPSQCVASCGNAVVDDREQCDDGNDEDGDGCSAGCEYEGGFICEGSPSVCCRDQNDDGECDEGGEFILASGGGCYCQGGPGSDSSLPLVLLLYLGVLAVRRRGRGA